MDPDPDLIRIQDLDDQKPKKKLQQNFFSILFDQKLQFTYVQVTGEALNPQKRTSSTSKNERNLLTFFYGCL
jgi:hypothetical protein